MAQLWEVATGQPKGPPLKHDDAVTAVTFNQPRRTHGIRRQLGQDGAAVGGPYPAADWTTFGPPRRGYSRRMES